MANTVREFNVGDKVRVTQQVLSGDASWTGISEDRLLNLGVMTVRSVVGYDDPPTVHVHENNYAFSTVWLEHVDDNPWKLGVDETVDGYTVKGFGYVHGIPVYICNPKTTQPGRGLTAELIGANHLNNIAGRS